MTTYFTAPDGIDEPTLWAETDDPRKPVAILRHRDLGLMAHHWDELVARVIAGNPQPELSDQDAIRRYYQRVRESHPSPTLLAAVDEAEANDERLWALDKAALTQGIERVNNTDNLAAAIADRTENAAAALRVNELANKIDDLTHTPSPPSRGLMQVMPEWKPRT